MKILANFTDWAGYPERRKANSYGGIGYYRMAKPSACLTDHEVDLRGVDIDQYGLTLEENWDNIFKKYDVFWAVHYFHEQTQAAQCYFAKKHSKLLIYDLDDNYLDLPASNPVYDKFFKSYSLNGKDLGVKPSRNQATLTAALSFADALTVSTEPLKERMQKHFKEAFGIDKPIYVIPNMSDLNDFDFKTPEKDPRKVVIGYQGSTSHKEDLMMIWPAIYKIMKRHPNVHLEILGVLEKKDRDAYFGHWDMEMRSRVGLHPSTKLFREYPKFLSTMKWDIGIAPLVDDVFNRSKSHIKWMEYAAYKIPCIASRVYPYFMPIENRDTIIDGETGFLCRPPEWEATLERLVMSKSLRERVGNAAFNAIKDTWQYKDSKIQETFNQMLADLQAKKGLS